MTWKAVYFGFLAVACYVTPFWLFVIAAFLTAAYDIFKKKPKHPVQEGYYKTPEWKKVVDMFNKHVAEGSQSGGSFAVYYEGQLVVEIWGGYADEAIALEWTRETITQYYSTTKSVAAVVMATLVDQGLLDYDKPVSHYWPEFGQNGKEDITVLQVLSHQAGLAAVKNFTFTSDHKVISTALAESKTNWIPGTAHGYHALSIGFLEDQILRRVDPKKRSLAQYFHEEIAKPLELDMFIGLPKEENYRCARVVDTMSKKLVTARKYWPMFYNFVRGTDKLLRRAFFNPRGMGQLSVKGNHATTRAFNSPATHGFGTANALAKFFGLLANGSTYNGVKILSDSAVSLLTQPVVQGLDKLLRFHTTYGRGVSVWTSPRGNYIFGAPGTGSQVGKCDPVNKIGIAYITNYLTPFGFGDDPKYEALEKLVYEIVEELESKDSSKH